MQKDDVPRLLQLFRNMEKTWDFYCARAKTASCRRDVTHPAAFLRDALASFAAVAAITRLVGLGTLQTQKEEEVTNCGIDVMH